MIDPMETHWETIQAKTFTKWINDKFVKGGYKPICNIYEDIRDGVCLGNLLTVLLNSKIYFNKSPFTRIQKVENLEILLKHIKKCGLSLINIGPEDIVDGNKKLILGLIWTLISKLSITNIGFESSVRNELLRWCAECTKLYKNVNVIDLSRSWQDGLAFNALIHHFRPDLIEYDELKPNDRHKNLSQAFEIAEKKLNIPKLLDVEDVADVVRPCEKIMITYLTEFYKKFSKLKKDTICKNLVENFLSKVELSIQGRNFYEIMARSFFNKQKIFDEKFNKLQALVVEVKDLMGDLTCMNSDLLKNYTSMFSTYSEIKEIHRMYNMKDYVPPEDIRISNMKYVYTNINSCIKDLISTDQSEISLNEIINDFTSICIREETIQDRIKDLIKYQKNIIDSKIKGQDADILNTTVKKHGDFLQNLLKKSCNKESIIQKSLILYERYSQHEGVMVKDLSEICTQLGLYIDDDIILQIQNTNGIINKDQYLDCIGVLNASEYDSVLINKAFSNLGREVYDINESDYINLVNYSGKKTGVVVSKLVDEFMKK